MTSETLLTSFYTVVVDLPDKATVNHLFIKAYSSLIIAISLFITHKLRASVSRCSGSMDKKRRPSTHINLTQLRFDCIHCYSRHTTLTPLCVMILNILSNYKRICAIRRLTPSQFAPLTPDSFHLAAWNNTCTTVTVLLCSRRSSQRITKSHSAPHKSTCM